MRSVTVAIPTARRPAGLRRLLDGLPAAIGDVPAEVLVVDNEAHGPAEPLVRAAPLPVRYVCEPTPGSAHARNRALAETRTELIAYLDDDVVPSPGWLEALLAGTRDGAVAAGGPVVLAPEVPRPRWFDEPGIAGYLSAHDLGDERRALGEGEYLLTANAVFDVAALAGIGGFDPRLGPRGAVQLVGDDVHVVRELLRLGDVRWEPGAVVTHDLPPARLTRGYLLRRAYWQGRSDWLLDEQRLRARRAGGARVAADWLAAEVVARRRQGLRRPEVRFHLATDVARTAGALRQALGWRGGRPVPR